MSGIYGKVTGDCPTKALLYHLPPEILALIMKKIFYGGESEAHRFEALMNSAAMEKEYEYAPNTILGFFNESREAVYREIAYAATHHPIHFNRRHVGEFIEGLCALEAIYYSSLPFKWFIAGPYAAYLDRGTPVDLSNGVTVYVIVPAIVFQRAQCGSDSIRQEMSIAQYYIEGTGPDHPALYNPLNRTVQEVLDFVNRTAEPPPRRAMFLPGVQKVRYRRPNNPFVIEIVHGYTFFMDPLALQRVSNAADVMIKLPADQQIAYLNDAGKCTLNSDGVLINKLGEILDKDNAPPKKKPAPAGAQAGRN